MLMLPEKLTLSEATDTLRMLEQTLQHEGKEPLEVDASGVTDFDSAALAVLLECRRLAQAWERPFIVRGAPGPMRALATLYGVAELLALEPAAA